MKKEKWLLKEINLWQQDALIDMETAEKLKSRYTFKKNINLLIVMFSIIGSLLLGTGFILILAKNWYSLPLFLRAAFAFLPLVTSQALAVFVVKAKYENIAWRESAAILVTASVFTVNAMVSQVFHLPDGEYSAYILACGLLSLPVIYTLNAVSPLLVYYWAILNWAALEHSPVNAPILLVLFCLGALYVFLKRGQINAKLMYMFLLTIVAGFVLILIMGAILKCSLLLAALCYFVLLLSFEELPEQLFAPVKIISTLSSLITVAILTYERMWSYRESPVNAGGGTMIGVMLAASLFFSIRIFKRDKLKFLFVMALILLSLARFIWGIFDLGSTLFALMLTGASNLIMLSIGVGFIIYGAKNTALSHINTGMAAVCALIVMRFFDSDLDLFWRGIVFLLLGAGFLFVNLKILRAKKQAKKEVRI